MNKGLFITATGTDVGKTYISGLILKEMTTAGYDCGYYKAALSGADSVENSDAGYVKNVANVDANVSYLYKTPVSPHLAARLEGNAVCMEKVIQDYEMTCNSHEYVVVEGSGGIVCPIRWDEKHIMLTDIVKALCLSVLIVANSGPGTINATVLTVEYLKQQSIPIAGIILNNYSDTEMTIDNLKMIKELTDVTKIWCVKKGQEHFDAQTLASLFEEIKK